MRKRQPKAVTMNVQVMGRQAGGGQSNAPPTFIKGSGKKNMLAANTRMNVVGTAPERKGRVSHKKVVLRNYMKTKVHKSMLDLSFLSKASVLAAVDLTCNFNAKPFVDMLFDVIADDMPPIESLNLEGNNIATLSHFKQCAEEHNLLGFVRNLNLTNNQLHSFKELDCLKPFKLAEIILKDNPIAANKREYAKNVVTRLPTVDIVDQHNVSSVRSQLKPRLPPIPATFLFLGDGTQELVFNFCQRYFKALDEGKYETDLLEAYSPDCVFSLTTNRTLGIGYGLRAEAITRNLREVSHNLCQMKVNAAPARTVHRGRLETIRVLKEKVLGGMTTKHDLTGFEVDAMPLAATLPQQVITVTIHGCVSFNVQLAGSAGGKDCGFTRCFDRTFVLAPPAESRVAVSDPWPAIILNDMLHLRPLKDHPVMKPVVDASAPPDMEEAKRQALARMMASETRLTVEYSKMCLDAANWDLKAAQALLASRKGDLPAEAWQK